MSVPIATRKDQAEPILPSSGRLALVTSYTREHTRETFTRAETNLLWALPARTITKVSHLTTISKPTVFVLGCSGSVGSAAVRALSTKYSGKLNILAGTRDVASEKVASLRSLPGVTILQADMNNKEALRDLLTGVTSLFIVTPSNGFRLAIGAAEASKASHVKHILTVSGLTVELPNTMYGKLFGELESNIKLLQIPYTLIRLPSFVDNYWAYKHPIQQNSSFSTPADPTKPLAAVVVEDAGKAAAAIMVEPEKHYGKTYRLISNHHTLNELAVAFSQALGKDVRHERISYETFRCQLVDVVGFSEENADAVLETYRLIDEESPVVNQPEYTPESSHFAQITGEKPTSLQEWINQVASSFK